MPDGVVVLESLRSPEVLDRVAIGHRATFTVEPAPGQPSTWTLVEFDLVDTDSLRLAFDLHDSLLPGPWYVDFTHDGRVYVAFPDSVFVYDLGDAESHGRAVAHALASGIPESQADWAWE